VSAIGPLRHLIEIDEPARISDEGGGAATAWNFVETLWCAIERLPSFRDGVGERANHYRRIAATIRWRPGVKLGDRIRFNGEKYLIVSIEAARDPRRMTLIGEEVRS